MYWCPVCKQVEEDDEVSISRDYYEAWGHEFFEEDFICPTCGTSLENYEGQDEEIKMDEIREKVEKLAEDICDNFCRYSGTGEDGKCEYCKNHNNKCPLDDVMREVGLI